MKTILALLLLPVAALAQVHPFDLQIQQRNAANTGWAWKHLPCGTLTGDGGLVFLSATKVPTCVKLGPNITISGGVMNVPVTTGPQGPQGEPSTVPGPQGPAGSAATISAGTAMPLASGASPTVTNIGTSSAAVFNFGIPAGAKGDTGTSGSAATIAVGTVTSLPAGSSATVTNAGTSSAATFNFGIPAGATGPAGPSAYGAPTARTVALATAYQCTNTAKPCIITITLQSQSSISLAGASNNEGAITLGSTSGVATGTGTNIAVYKNNLGGGLVVGLNLNSQQANSYFIAVPAGWYFAVRQTSGTGLQVVSAFEQLSGS